MMRNFGDNFEPLPAPSAGELPGVAWSPGLEAVDDTDHIHSIADEPGTPPTPAEVVILGLATARAVDNFRKAAKAEGRKVSPADISAHLATIPGLGEQLGLTAEPSDAEA